MSPMKGRRMFMCVLLCGLLAGWQGGRAEAAVTFTPIDDRWAVVGQGVLQPDGTFLQVGNAQIFGQAPILGFYRPAMEFNLSALSGTTSSWTLQITPAETQAITSLQIYGYLGDGVVSLSDLSQTSTLVGAVTIPPFASGVSFSVDITSFVQAALAANNTVLGFMLLGTATNANNPALYTRIASRNHPTGSWRPQLIAELSVITVAVDIKPGDFPNIINPRSGGVIPVAILTTYTFDARTVNSATVRFGPTGTEAAPVHSALEDVDGDGDVDMILHFDTSATGIQCGHVSAALTGQTVSGQSIEGSDSLKTLSCK